MSYSPSLCPLFASYRMFSYVTGRIILYCFFISRTNDIFKDTTLRFSNLSMLLLLTYPIITMFSIVFPASFIYFTMQNWSIISSANHIGTYCIGIDQINSNASLYIKYVFMWGSFNDSSYAVVTLFLMISRLFTLIVESENNRKSVHSRFSIHTQLSSLSQADKISAVPPTNDAPIPVQGPYSPQAVCVSIPLPHNPNKFKFASSDTVSTSSKQQTKQAVSPKDAVEFHKKTEDQNELILLISKFFILLCSMVLSSYFVLILFIIYQDIVLILYSFDTFVNIICLYLSFAFSGKYYNQYLCGKYCTKWCFPVIKTVTLQCSSYERHYKNRNGIKRQINKCCIYCKCCCFGYCCDENINWESTKNIYSLAQFEVELMVLSGNRTEQTEKQANDGK
eukprot:387620_1